MPHGRIHLAQSAALMLKLVASTDMLTLLPWPLIECEGAHGLLVPLNLDTRFAPREIGVLRRRQGALSPPAGRFLHHLMAQLRQCQDSTDPMLQRVFRSIDLID